METNSENFLGIDWGQADIGLSLADAETRIAFGYDVIKNDQYLMQNLEEIIPHEGIGTIVIGLPMHLGNNKGFTEEIKKMGNDLRKEFNVDVYYKNEMFTTKMAEANLIEKGVKGLKKYDDEEAARIILQEWLDNQNK